MQISPFFSDMPEIPGRFMDDVQAFVVEVVSRVDDAGVHLTAGHGQHGGDRPPLQLVVLLGSSIFSPVVAAPSSPSRLASLVANSAKKVTTLTSSFSSQPALLRSMARGVTDCACVRGGTWPRRRNMSRFWLSEHHVRVLATFSMAHGPEVKDTIIDFSSDKNEWNKLSEIRLCTVIPDMTHLSTPKPVQIISQDGLNCSFG